MPPQSIIERSFSGGEISPALYARTDHVKYATGLRALRNMVCMRHGGVTQRPGTMYIGVTLNGGATVRLIPFIFNETGTGQSYVLEFGNGYIAFYQNGGVVLSGGSPYTIPSPYSQSDLEDLNFSQSADVVTIVHPSYAPRELTRVAPTNWTITTPNLQSPIAGPTALIASYGGGAGTLNYEYVVTAVSDNGDETNYETAYPANITGGVVSVTNVSTLSFSNKISLTWNAVTGAVFYRIYKLDDQGGTLPNLGFIAESAATQWFDTGITPDYTNQPPHVSPFQAQASGDHPSTVGFIQQRRIFASTNNNPLGVWGSRPGSFDNFDYHVGSSPDDDPYTFTIAGEEVNSIEHILELKSMLLLTAGAEFFVQGNGSGIVTPSSINSSAQSSCGSSPLRPLRVGDILIFNQALGSFIRDLSFDFVIDGYRGNDITIFSAHLFEGHQIVDWCFQKTPDSIIWAVRDDGVLLSCTYVREQQILAWARHDFTNGLVEKIVSIPENGNYAVYAVINRTINGSTVRYIERISSRIWTDPLNMTYLDCFSSYDGRNTGSTTMTLTASGSFESGTGTEYRQQLTLTASAGFFTAAMVGNEIFLQNSMFVSSQGKYGTQIRCTIQAYTSDTIVTVTPNKGVPSEFQVVATTNWSRAVKTITGLSYLEGQQVSVWADRFLVGSPLNQNVSTVYTVTGGSVTLDNPYSVIYIGLPMIADFETLGIDTFIGESILDQPKNTSRVVVYLYNTRGFFGGTQNPDTDPNNIVDGIVQDYLYNLMENKDQESRLSYDQPPPLMTDPAFTNVPCNWSKEGRIFIRNVDPIPLSILAVVPSGLTAGKNPDSLKV